MTAETSPTPSGRDWLDLSRPADAARPDLPWSARARQGAARLGGEVRGRLQVQVTGRLGPPLRAAGGRLGGHPGLRRLAAEVERTALSLGRVRWGRVAAGLALGVAVPALALLGWAAATLPPLSGPVPAKTALTVQAQDGEVVAVRATGAGRALAAEAVAPAMRQAMVAARDPHVAEPTRLDGYGIFSIIRGAFRDAPDPAPRAGSPLLTQELVRSSLLGGERGLIPSVQEAMLVLWLEATATRDEILTRALNTAPFGPGLTGIDAAARRVFGKEADALSLAEAAALAGLTVAPATLRPDRDGTEMQARARHVLDTLVMTGTVSRTRADEAARALPGLAVAGTSAVTRSGLPDLVAAAARERAGGSPDLVVRTSLDRAFQGAAEAAVSRRLESGARRAAALLALAPDGAVVAVAGGAPLGTSPAARAAAEASLRRIERDGRPVHDRIQAAALPEAALRERVLALLPALARDPAAPGGRDGFTLGSLDGMLVGTWFSAEDERTPEAGAGDAPDALWRDFATQVQAAQAQAARPQGPQAQAARTRPAPAAEARAPWQNPEIKTASTTPRSLRGVPKVVDTGRLRLDGQMVRLAGVEGQGGRLAREFRQYLRKREVDCTPAGEPETYRCRAGTQDLSEVVLFNGAGRAAPGAPPELAAAEADARSRQAGLWQN
ncbi:MAG: transglycosylase domain-containing protein [Methylobacterium frigidaeris]